MKTGCSKANEQTTAKTLSKARCRMMRLRTPLMLITVLEVTGYWSMYTTPKSMAMNWNGNNIATFALYRVIVVGDLLFVEIIMQGVTWCPNCSCTWVGLTLIS